MGYLPYELVQEFFHQQYVPLTQKTPILRATIGQLREVDEDITSETAPRSQGKIGRD